MNETKTSAATHAEIRYPGLAVNESGKTGDTTQHEDERTRTLNNNPRTSETDDTTTPPHGRKQ